MKTSIMFLLGSGVSVPGGFPSTGDLTTQVLTGNGIIRHTDGKYYLTERVGASEENPTDNYLPKVLSLIQEIQRLIGDYKKQKSLNCISHEKLEQYGLHKPETIGEFIG